MQNSIFENWTARCSWLGNIMTNLPDKSLIPSIKAEISDMEVEKKTLVNKNGNKVKWTDAKEENLNRLKAKLEGLRSDKLPNGAITALEEEYIRVKYNRKKTLQNKYLDKGIRVENDSIELKAELDGSLYFKNEERISNDYLNGEPDIRIGKLIDIKSNYDIYTFNKAELTSDYEWQLKGYMFLEQTSDNELLNVKNEAELCYCLVNSKIEQLIAAKKSAFFNNGYSEEQDFDDPKFIEELKQIELNMIFDFEKFKKDYPNYDLELQPHERISIPKTVRTKSFNVRLDSEDISHITRRVLMARKWLIERDILSQSENIL